MMIKSGRNFAHAMTAKLLWHVQICDLIRSSKLELEEQGFSQELNYVPINSLWNGTLVVPEGDESM